MPVTIDGHSGIENRKVNEVRSGDFEVVLAALKEARGRVHLVIHATAHSYGSSLPAPLFLASIELQQFHGACPFWRERCFWRHLAILETDDIGRAQWRQTEMVHQAFKTLGSKLSDLYRLQL
jgi:hypothetical protein